MELQDHNAAELTRKKDGRAVRRCSITNAPQRATGRVPVYNTATLLMTELSVMRKIKLRSIRLSRDLNRVGDSIKTLLRDTIHVVRDSMLIRFRSLAISFRMHAISSKVAKYFMIL